MGKKDVMRMQITLSRAENEQFERVAKAAGFEGVRDWCKFLLRQAATAANIKLSRKSETRQLRR